MGGFWRRVKQLFEFRFPNYNDDYENSFCIFLIRISLVIIAFIFYICVVSTNKNYYDIISVEQSQTLVDYYGDFETNFTKQQFDPQSNVTNEQIHYFNRFWSPTDYIVQSYDRVFSIFTNFGVNNVTQGYCTEDPQYDESLCDIKTNKPCVAGKQSTNGVQTGNCTTIPLFLQKYYEPDRWHVCEIHSWCPAVVWPPLKQEEGGILSGTNETVIGIESIVQFSQFGIQLRTNTIPKLHCIYDPILNKNCPFFKLADIIKFSHNNNKDYEWISVKTGAVVDIKVDWNCGHLSDIDNCKPEFSFWRRDNQDVHLPRMWSETSKLDGDHKLRIYGWKIQFEIFVSGSVKLFNFYTLITSVFAHLSIFGFGAMLFAMFVRLSTSTDPSNRNLCDSILCPKRNRYEYAASVQDDTENSIDQQT